MDENLVRGHISASQGGKGGPTFNHYHELHLTTAGEKLLKSWKWRWWRRVGLILGAAVVAVESFVSLVTQLLTANQGTPP